MVHPSHPNSILPFSQVMPFTWFSENIISDIEVKVTRIQKLPRFLVHVPMISIWSSSVTLFYSFHIHKLGYLRRPLTWQHLPISLYSRRVKMVVIKVSFHIPYDFLNSDTWVLRWKIWIVDRTCRMDKGNMSISADSPVLTLTLKINLTEYWPMSLQNQNAKYNQPESHHFYRMTA